MAKSSMTQPTPYDSPSNLVYWCQRSGRNSNGVIPTGAPCRGVYHGRFVKVCGQLHVGLVVKIRPDSQAYFKIPKKRQTYFV